MRDFWAEVRLTIYALSRQNKITSIFYSLAMPTLIGIFATYYTDIVKVNPLLFWLPVSFFLFAAFASAMITWDIKLAPELLLDLSDSEKKIKNLESSTEYLSLLQEQILVWSAMVRKYMKNANHETRDLHEAISQICNVMIADRDDFFGFRRQELWNFAVYIYDPEKTCLLPVWREKHPSHPSRGPGRGWAPGKGHVGLAFLDGKTKITSDATAPDVRDLMTPSLETLSYDASAYRSFVSEPIGPVDGERHPIGVLVATSNVVGRFHLGNALVLRHAASAIATLVHVAYSDTVVAELAKRPCRNSAQN